MTPDTTPDHAWTVEPIRLTPEDLAFLDARELISPEPVNNDPMLGTLPLRMVYTNLHEASRRYLEALLHRPSE